MALLSPLRASVLRTTAAAAAWLMATTAAGGQGPSLEYAIKANYLCKFGPFVEWPAGVFAGASAPFNVCVVGQDPFGSALDEATRGQVVAGHPVAVRRLHGAGGASGCQVVYVSRSGAQATEVIQALRGSPVLIVTDDAQPGGVIQFVMKGGRVRFAIDLAQAQADGLAISSKLLELATAVQPTLRPPL